MPVETIKNFRRADARIATAGQPTEAELGEVWAGGYAAVVNLGLLDPRYCLSDEAGLAASLGLAYRHLPVAFGAPTREDFETFIAVMDEWADRRVFVHCAANYRVSCFVALYGELRLGWTRPQADGLIQTVWTPDEIWRRFLEEARERFARR